MLFLDRTLTPATDLNVGEYVSGFDLICQSQLQTPMGYLQQDINDGVQCRTHNYLRAVWTNSSSLAATSFYLDVDSKCERSNQFVDVTNGSTLHCDCRYLIPKVSQNEKPITEIYFSKNHSEHCTDDINKNRPMEPKFSLYLCWKTAPGKGVCNI